MVLVTGASGFLGRHLVRYLSAQGFRVRALFHSHTPPDELKSLVGVEWRHCDLLDVFEVEECMESVTHIYHCAAVMSFDSRRRREMLHFNLEGTANLVNEAITRNVEKLVHVSSIAALGRTPDTEKVMNEDEEWGESEYNSAYGISKYLAETEVWRGIGEGLNAVIVNPGIILGAGNWNEGSARLMKIANEEFPFYTVGMTAWVDVADVVKAMTLLMASGVQAERFIVSSGNHRYREIFTLMANALHKKPPHYHAGSFITGMAWRLSALKCRMSGKSALITRETAANARGIAQYNNEKLLNTLPGFSYMPISESIALMAQSFMNSI